MAYRSECGLTSIVDATGTLCPLPLIKAQEHARFLQPGAEFELLANDPGVYQDIPAWCRMHGHRIVSTVEESHIIHMRIRTNNDES